jgi:uncharacterized protein YqcC (DUF446 family)
MSSHSAVFVDRLSHPDRLFGFSKDGPMPKKSSSVDLYSKAERKISEMETEMKRIGYWSLGPLPEEAYDFQQAFAMDTMAFSQWLQFILIPNVRSIIEQKGDFPSESMVGVQAAREFDGDANASYLVSLLSEFDALFRKGKK